MQFARVRLLFEYALVQFGILTNHLLSAAIDDLVS